MPDAQGVAALVIPQGGGALSGLGEKFSPDLHTGTGNFAVPLGLPAGRNGFQPQLTLSYSTGQGNGPFGMGWSLGVPGVSRKTSKGIPRYDDSADVFLLSGSEDLAQVEKLQAATRYRPRTEGLFAEILYRRDPSTSHWEVRSKDGLTSVYGTPGAFATDSAVIANPADPTRIFGWKLTSTTDSFGNRVEYEYARDRGVDGPHHWDQLYLTRIQYCDYSSPAGLRFLVSVNFVYEDRLDALSDYRSGFEIRTRKRCSQIAVSTHTEVDTLIRTWQFEYLAGASLPLNGASLLSRIVVTGHDGTAAEALPPLDFSYSAFTPEKREFSPLAGPDLPARSLASGDLELVDLFGQGLPDLLEMNGTTRFWRNAGGTFELPRFMQEAPAGIKLSDPGVQLLDADGDGRMDLMITAGPITGYFPASYGGAWDRQSFQRSRTAPSFDLKDPEVKLVDLTGDGVTDAVRSGSRLELFYNDPQQGWVGGRQVERAALDAFPNVSFSDPRVRWADMTGDGLQDILLVYDGSVEYWPHLGYGNWARRIHMQNSPHFPFNYDLSRILIGDVDGDGLADLVYVDDRNVTLWINQSGNRWSDPILITGTPRAGLNDAIRLADMLGSGIAGVLWSCEVSAVSRAPLLFLDFVGGKKPYLLQGIDNHLGSITRIEYAPSTKFFTEDRKSRTLPWKTTLPFPVQVVARSESIDVFSGSKLTTEYRYHHGYWDGGEREFRGFGLVEQFDTEVFAQYSAPGLHGENTPFAIVDPISFSPPTLTRTWFHQGPVGPETGNWQELDLSAEYWSGDPNLLRHTEAVNAFLDSWPATANGRRARRDALRSLRGSILRTEFYGRDGTAWEDRPYTVAEHSYAMVEVEPPGASEPDRTRIFFPHALAERTTQWERGDDPMTQFGFTGEFDPFGQPQVETRIACPRGWRNLNDAPGEPYLATRARTHYAVPIAASVYMHNRVAHTTSWEIRNSAGKQVLDLAALSDTSVDLAVIGHKRQFYDGNAFIGLPLNQVGSHGAVSRVEALVMTDDILRAAYGTAVPPYLAHSGPIAWGAEYPMEFRAALPPLAGYVFHAGSASPTDPAGYYLLEERRRYDFQSALTGRGMVLETLDPTGNPSVVDYDRFQFSPERVTDAAGLFTSAKQDYRVLKPAEVVDPNGTTTRYSFTPFGLLASVSLLGNNPAEGDRVRPSVRMEYGFLAFTNSAVGAPKPVFVRTIRQVHHDTETDVPLPERDQTITTVEYSDGFGRLLQTRTEGEQVRFGNAVFGGGDEVLPAAQSGGAGGDVTGVENASVLSPNTVVSGWQVYDNKGRVVEKYEPFFSTGWDYGQPQDAQLGEKLLMFYDPRGQLIRTVNPDGSEQTVLRGLPGGAAGVDLDHPELITPTPWEAYTYDVNDNAGRTHGSDPAVQRYRHHWNTPSSLKVDALGRTVEIVERDRDEAASPSSPLPPVRENRTQIRVDVQGNPISSTDPLNRIGQQSVYDLLNRRLRLQTLDGGVRRTFLDPAAQVLEHRDSKGALLLHSYDPLNRPLRFWARDNAGEGVTLRERLVYGDGSSASQPPATRAANRAANRLARLANHLDEAGSLEYSRYDFKGNVVQKSRQVISDAAILKVFAAAGAGGTVSAFRVDWDDPLHTALDPRVYQTDCRYDALNRIELITHPSDLLAHRRVLRPHHNNAGTLESLTVDGETFVERIAYDARGQRIVIAYGNGVMTRYAYDPQTFRLLRQRTEAFTKPAPLSYRGGGPILQDFQYTYDLAGNPTEIQDRTPQSGIPGTALGINGLDREFTYDPLYRLKLATGRETDFPPDPPWDGSPRSTDLTLARAWTEHYQFDAAGNFQELKHQTGGGGFTKNYLLGPGTNRLQTVATGATTFTYSYDTNGNLTDETAARHFEWDHGDQLRVFRIQTPGTGPSLHTHYLYDSQGVRVKKLVRMQGGNVDATVYVDNFEHHRIVQGGVIRQNDSLLITDNRDRFAEVRVGPSLTSSGSPPVRYHIGDHLGSSNVVVGGATASGSLFQNREEQSPFGETTFGSYATKRLRFTKKERDEESGTYYFGMRYYAPHLGRWLSCDPLDVALGKRDANSSAQAIPGHGETDASSSGTFHQIGAHCSCTYTYVYNRPLGLVDKAGLTPYAVTLSKERLDVLAAENNIGIDKAPVNQNRAVGRWFQKLLLTSIGLVENGRPFPTMVRDLSTEGNRGYVVPDAVADQRYYRGESSWRPVNAAERLAFYAGIGGTTLPDSSFYEFKALKSGTVINLADSETQIKGMIDAAAQTAATKDPKAITPSTLHFITTSGVIVGPDVVAYATGKDVLLVHHVAEEVRSSVDDRTLGVRVGAGNFLNPEVAYLRGASGLSSDPNNTVPLTPPRGVRINLLGPRFIFR